LIKSGRRHEGRDDWKPVYPSLYNCQMKFEDDSQNLRVRLRVIQTLALLLLAVLGVRLYMLQVVNGRRYAERAENQRLRLLPIPAPRGVIFDRAGHLLVDSRPIYNVIMSREDMKNMDFGALVTPLSDGLGIDPDALRERFEQVKSQPAFESILIKENATQADISWVEAHALEQPELRVEQQPQRRYPENGVLAHVLGYVGEISPEQLELPRYKEKGYKPGDIIGKEGLEAVYDDYLRGKDGYRKVVVDSRGHVQSEIEVVPPEPGQDLVTTIDLDLQETAEEQLRNSPSKRGVIVVMDPNNGEIMALASYPTYDPRGPRRIRGDAERPAHPARQPRDSGTLPARLDVEGSDVRGRLAAGRDYSGAFKSALRRRHHHRQQVYALHGQSRHARAALCHHAFLRRLFLPPRPEDGHSGHHGDGGRV
jgi:cell division protein FtsI/penicillin-binding protein 2